MTIESKFFRAVQKMLMRFQCLKLYSQWLTALMTKSKRRNPHSVYLLSITIKTMRSREFFQTLRQFRSKPCYSMKCLKNVFQRDCLPHILITESENLWPIFQSYVLKKIICSEILNLLKKQKLSFVMREVFKIYS